ncbi:MAG: hypothetical protein AAGF11_24620 [Myxococcota bacterium]
MSTITPMSTINWNYPPPRTGVFGLLDRFVGPGATRVELALQFGAPLVAMIAAALHGATVAPDWGVLQYIVSVVLAFDILGGIITNATSSAKRWYHRPGRTARDHLGFVIVHLVHLSVVSWVFEGGQLGWAITPGGYLLVAAAIIVGVPRYLQRPVAYTSMGGGLLLAIYAVPAPLGLEWFLPLFYLKLLVSHLPVEEPYRPTANNHGTALPTPGTVSPQDKTAGKRIQTARDTFA